MGLKLVSEASTLAVTVEEAKLHLRYPDSDQDSMIETYVRAAIGWCEQFTGQAFMAQTWDQFLDEFPEDAIKIEKPPLLDVTGVFYTDGDGVEQEIDSANYTTDTASDFPWILPATNFTWPTPLDAANAVRIRFRAGFVDTAVSPVTGRLPEAVKAAILLTLGHLFANREEVIVGQTPSHLPFGAKELLRRGYRKQLGMA